MKFLIKLTYAFCIVASTHFPRFSLFHFAFKHSPALGSMYSRIENPLDYSTHNSNTILTRDTQNGFAGEYRNQIMRRS